MNRLLLFIKKIYVFLLFIILEAVALNYYANSTSYTRAKMLTASNSVAGYIHKGVSDAGDYIGLRRENDMLLERLAELENENNALREIVAAVPDSLELEGIIEGKYRYFSASVINNSISQLRNHIVIDKGERDGVRPNMALITPDNTIVGYVLDVSDKFAVATSVLNTADFRTGGRIKNTDNYGSVWWDGTDHSYITLSEVPKYAEINQGDTIVTGYSSIFPPDVLIGTVESFKMNQANYFDVRVKLATRMSGLGRILVIDYADIQERMLLEEGLY